MAPDPTPDTGNPGDSGGGTPAPVNPTIPTGNPVTGSDSLTAVINSITEHFNAQVIVDDQRIFAADAAKDAAVARENALRAEALSKGLNV